jgi:hypothetical protein
LFKATGASNARRLRAPRHRTCRTSALTREARLPRSRGRGPSVLFAFQNPLNVLQILRIQRTAHRGRLTRASRVTRLWNVERRGADSTAWAAAGAFCAHVFDLGEAVSAQQPSRGGTDRSLRRRQKGEESRGARRRRLKWKTGDVHMKRAIILATLLFGMVFASESAFAQSATYDWVVKNTASFSISEDSPPTGSATRPYFSGSISSGGSATVTTTETIGYVSATLYMGSYQTAPYNHELQCSFSVNNGQINSNGTCSTPYTSQFAHQGTGYSPTCNLVAVTPIPAGSTTTCHYKITFSYGATGH